MSVNFEHFLYGGDYNPDQWLEYPDILKEDIRLMKQAHINTVSLGIFAWAKLEPAEGVYDFDWMEEIIDRLYENGISVNLATPSGARPHWRADQYPEVPRVNEMRHDVMRSMKGEPFLMMESCPGAMSWVPVSKLKRPGMLEASSLQAIAHGSDSVLYFQIRKGRGGYEKLHGAVIDHYGKEDDRTYQVVAAPMAYMFRAGFEEKVRAFVECGGVFIMTYWSGVVDKNDLCFLGGTPDGKAIFGEVGAEMKPFSTVILERKTPDE